MAGKQIFINSMLTDSIIVIDIRPAKQYDIGHIPGSLRMPLPPHMTVKRDFRTARGHLARLSLASASKSWADQVAGLLKEKSQVVIISQGGGVRAAYARDAILPYCRCYIYKGGYRAWRRRMTSQFRKKFNFIVLTGKTGSGKTLILNKLNTSGYQVLNTESLAKSAGSVFGRIGLKQQQPTQEQFENLLASRLAQFDQHKPVFSEWEPRPLGACHIPHGLWEALHISRHIHLEVPQEQRVKLLVESYGGHNDEQAAQGIIHLTERLGAQKAQQLIEALKKKDYTAVVSDLIAYFDNAKSYNEPPSSETLFLQAPDHDVLFAKLIKLFPKQ